MKNAAKIVIAAIALLAIVTMLLVKHGHDLEQQKERQANALMEPCLASDADPSVSKIPCLQKIIRFYPKPDYVFLLALELSMAGRYEESRKLFQQVADSNSVLAPTARLNLKPGAMQEARHFALINQKYDAILIPMSKKHNAKQRAFMQQHTVYHNGKPALDDAYKSELAEMQQQDNREEDQVRAQCRSALHARKF